MAGDPPLEQVVTRTFEAGVARRRRRQSAGAPASSVPATATTSCSSRPTQTGFGYFKNFGETRRQGVELGASGRIGTRHGRRRLHLPRRDVSERGDGRTARATAPTTRRRPAARARGHDRHRARRPDPAHSAPHVQGVTPTSESTSALSVDVDLVAVSGSFARGNENNQHQPDGVYYLGPGPHRRLRRRQPRRPLPADALAAAGRRRSTTCSTITTTPPRSSGRPGSPARATSSPGRCPPSAASSPGARHVLRARLADHRVIGLRFRI